MSFESLFAPDFKGRPYWWEAAEPASPSPGELPQRSDVVVVGGGYTGLSCALELARRGTSVTVLDADAIGFNASSRNGGLVNGGLKLALADMSGQLGAERADRLVREAIGTLPFIEDLIGREGIDCDFQRTGRFVCAYSRKHYDELAAKVDRIAELTGAPAYMVPPERQREEIGSDHYRGGQLVEAAAGLHPAKYVRGLAQAAERAGAMLFGKTRVTRLQRNGGRWQVETERGAIACEEVMIGTNAYTGPATPWLRRRVVPVASFLIATEPLPDALTRDLVPRGRVLADSRRVLSYFRLSPDGRRVLWGGRVGTAAMDPRESGRRLHAMMCRVWPQLQDVRITHSWTGNVAFTFDFIPHLGQHQGMHYALGCQGSGVAMQSWLGYQAARNMIGGPNEQSAFTGLPFPTIPLYDGRPWFLPGMLAWYKLRDHIDRLAG
ncbi:NAD(P)/FAD-dependent oxidoreductase [Rhodoligotrophos defluvii]|uniref:NAD(P)/FAD-dependent oxidoreductase n=1 Tax=Rhodoligotrophos defluvii TaxID=2561934 RepID=UPI0010C93A55|nr:FAD-binding oxidoreductase [Rhodoligotrophos defluvii]